MVIALYLALAVVFLLIVFWRQHVGALAQIASLLAGLLLMIWLQDNGYLDNGQNATGGGRAVPATRSR